MGGREREGKRGREREGRKEGEGEGGKERGGGRGSEMLLTSVNCHLWTMCKQGLVT